MTDLAEECLDILNDGHFHVVDPGPLHSPIRGFSLRRNRELTLILETDAAPRATSRAVEHRPGTVRFSTERAKLVSIAGIAAELVGVIPYQVMQTHSDLQKPTKETARVHLVQVTPGDPSAAAYTIDWLENLPDRSFVWPDSVNTEVSTTTTRIIGLTDTGITISSEDKKVSFRRAAAKLTIFGATFYVCALPRGADTSRVRPGCIVYDGVPDDLFRKKVRTALSFALGTYLVDLGYTLYDRNWHIVAAVARSAYSIGGRVFDMIPEQLAPLGKKYLYELDRDELVRAVGALVAAYDDLDLANLSWAYWHARTATVHIAPAHFGAAIEALQRAYIKTHPGVISKTLVPAEPWKSLSANIATLIAATDFPAEAKAALVDKLPNLNRVEQRPLLKAVLGAIGLQLGADEDSAWRRRNKAAHGMPIREGHELAAIRDMKLLKGLFHRMLLGSANAADRYIDYVSPDHDYRRLQDPPPTLGESSKSLPA